MDRIILCYHGIDENQLHCNVSRSLFHSQMNWINTLNYKFTSASNIIHDNSSIPSLVVTFDDGLESSLKAIICLLENNIPVLWSILALPDSSLHQELTDQLVSFSTLSKLLADYPHLEIASHSLTHRDLTKIPLREAYKEVWESRDRLQTELQVPVQYFVYPFGKRNKEISQFVKDSGYEAAFTTTALPVVLKCDRYNLPRLCVNEQLYPGDRLHRLLGWGGGTYLYLAHYYRKVFPKS